jgi:hypothetical protein
MDKTRYAAVDRSGVQNARRKILKRADFVISMDGAAAPTTHDENKRSVVFRRKKTTNS